MKQQFNVTIRRVIYLMLVVLVCLDNRGLRVSASPIEPLDRSAANDLSINAPDEWVLFVQYTITGKANGSGKLGSLDWSVNRQISIKGWAEIHKPIGGSNYAFPFSSIIQDDYRAVERTASCTTNKHKYLLDPYRYAGGGQPDPFWSYMDWRRWQRPNGTWYIAEPFFTYFTTGILNRTYSYAEDTQSCPWNFSQVFEEMNYNEPIRWVEHSASLEGGPAGTFFTRQEQWTQDYHTDYGIIPMHVTFDATVQVLNRCGGQNGVVEVSNPAVTALDVVLMSVPPILPDDQTTLKAKVTCQGVPVQNAQVQIGSQALNGSGGHRHDDDRPRGYLDGVKITAAQPHILRTTGADGTIDLPFAPGKDKRNEQIGISGLYEITAKAVGKPSNTARTVVDAGYPNLVKVVSDESLTVIGQTWPHFENSWATGATSLRLKLLAGTWRDLLADYDPVDAFPACDPLLPPLVWPPRLEVNDISLPRGGLFDVFGWDSQAGQMRGAPWEPPHYTHRDGTVVDFTLRTYEPCRRDLFRTLLIQRGRSYGTWQGGPTLTLRVNPTPGLTPSRMTAEPDLGAMAFRSDREVPTAAPGQLITYTLGVGNVNGTSDAHNVTLTGTLPTGLTFVNATPVPSRMAAANQPVWDFGTLSITQTKIVHVAAQVNAGIALGSVLTVTADTTTSDVEANLADNHDAALGVRIQPAGPDLIVQSDLGEVALTNEQPVTATIDVANYGNAIAPGAQLTFTLPPSVTLTSATPFTSSIVPNGYRWNLGSIGVDETRRVTLTLQLDPRLITDTLPFQIEAASSMADLNLDDNTLIEHPTIMSRGSDLVMWWNRPDMSALPTLNETITYTVNYANLGNQAAASTTLTLTLGTGLSIINATPAAQRTLSGTLAGWDLGTLDVGAAGAITITAKVITASTDSLVTWATVRSQTPDIDPANNTLVDYRSAFLSAAVSGNFRLFLPLVRR